mgnify:CR=1 FL=1
MYLKGRQVILMMGGVAIAAAKSCDVNIQVNTIKTASSTDGSWESSTPGRKSWSASCSHLVTQIADSAEMVGQTVTLKFQPMGDVTFYGITNNPTLATGTPPSSGYVVWDAIRKDFLWKHVPAPGVDVYFQNFSWKPALVVGNYYYNTVTSKTYTWTGSDLSEVSALTGSAIVKQWKGTFTTGNLAQGSYSFEGTGPLATPT